MIRRITIISFLLSILFCVGSWAQSAQHLVVWQKDGKKAYFDLTEEPRTTFENGLLVVSTNTFRTEYQRSNVLRYTFEGYFPDDIETPVGNSQGYRQDGDNISIYGMPEGTVVELFDTSGALLGRSTSNGSESINFTLAGRQKGVYLVKCGEQVLKFMKR